MISFISRTLLLLTCIVGALPSFSQSQDSILFYSAGHKETAAPVGVGYDSGGPLGNYFSGEYSTLLIDPGCAEKITISVTFYQVETCCDALLIYDGANDSAPLLVNVSGTGAPIIVQANSGKAFLRWASDGSVVGAGFRFTWTSTLITPVAPVVSFQVSDLQPALSEVVNFSAESTNFPINWAWDFGDGNGSFLKNPSHRYSQSGEKTVQLITTNCHGLKDTATTILQVQDPPVLTPIAGSLSSTVGCGDTAQFTFEFANLGNGELFYTSEIRLQGKPKVLIAIDYANQTSLLGLSNLLGFYSNDYEVELANLSTNSNALALLEETDILIFPTLDIGDPWPLMNYSAAIDSFIYSGGSVIVCGQQYYHAPASAFNLFPGADYYTQEFSGQPIQLSTTHPITNGLSASLTAPLVTNGFTNNNPNFVSLCTKDGKSIIGYRELTKGKIVHLGFGFQSFNFTLAQVLTQTLNWCGKKLTYTIVPAGSIVQPGDTLQMAVSLPTTGFFPSTYSGAIFLTSNDPAFAPSLQVPFNLTVTGQAVPSFLPQEIAFDTIQQGSTSDKSFYLQNTGCSPLLISGVDSIPLGFTVDNLPLELAPYTDTLLSVSFSPIDTGSYTGSLFLATNVGSISLPLSGYASGAPNLVWANDTLHVEVTCGDSVVVTVLVENTGIGSLELIADGGSQNGGSTLRALILDAVSYNSGIGSNMQNWLENRYEGAKYQVTRYHSGQQPSDLQATMQNMDLVVIPNYANVWWMPPSELGVILRDYMASGGTVIFTGSSFPYEFSLLGLSNVQNYIVTFSETLGYSAPNDPLVEGVTAPVAGPDPIFSWKFNDSDWEKIVFQSNYQEYTVAGYKRFDLGQLVYLGFEYYYDSEPGNTILGNVAEWAADGNLLSFPEINQEIPPGTSDTLQVTIRTESRIAGTYQLSANWLTNDPSDPILSVPISVQVIGAAQLTTPQTQYSFGLTQQYSNKLLDLAILNEGCDTLWVQNTNMVGADFTVVSAPTFIKPFNEGSITVQFAPTTPGTKNGTLSLITNGGEAQFTFSGIAIGAPFATFGPTELGATLVCDESYSDTIQLTNTGLSGLSYQYSQSNTAKRIGILFYGANISRAYNIQNFISYVDPTAHVSRVESESISQFADSLQNWDLLIIPSLELNAPNQIAVYNGFAPHIQAFLNSGKNVAVLGASNAGLLEQLGLFSSVTLQITSFTNLECPIRNHPLVAQFATKFFMDDNLAIPSFPSSEAMTSIWKVESGLPALSYKREGNGIVLFSSNSYDYYTERVLQMLSNILNWMQNPYPPGAEPIAATGAIGAGQSNQLVVNFDGENVPAGNYPGFVRFTSNAPLQKKIQVPITVQLSNGPCAGFTTTYTSCSSVVQFSDASINGIFTWYWQFGDGFDSFEQNPSHEYSVPGTYTASLIACSNVGCDTFTQQIVISTNNGPIPSICTPGQSPSICCATGIYSVQVGSAFIYSSDGANEGYQDRSCSHGVDIIRQLPYELRVSTGNQQFEYVSVWVDFNNNGAFDQNELVLNDNNLILHTTIFSAPAWAVKNTPLRMRVLSESTSYAWPGACGTPVNGQVEEYYIIVREPSSTTSASDLLEGVEVYPNPSTGECWLSFSTTPEEAIDVTLLDELGKEIQAFSISNNGQPVRVPTPASLSAGTYVLRIQAASGVAVKKWQKM
jgi:PKD repeat protein